MTPALRRQKLTLQVHIDAFRSDPLSYLQAIGWRLRGLKLRSRNRFAELMGRSPHAYALWMEKIEPTARAAYSSPGAVDAQSILTVIDASGDPGGIQDTIKSLGTEPGQVVVISAQPIGGPFERIGTASDISRLVGSDTAWLCILRAGDQLSPDAFAVYERALANFRDSWIIYSDDDLIGAGGVRHSPHFKPDWNSDLFEHHDFVTGSALVKVTSQLLRSVESTDWAEALVRKVSGRGQAPAHVPLVLHHRKCRQYPIPPAKKSIQLPASTPSVSAIIPTRNQLVLLRNCIDGLKRTDHPTLDIVIVDNGSEDARTLEYLAFLEKDGLTVLRSPGPFNYSALNNAAVRVVRSDYLCFLNNDVEMIDGDWLGLLMGHAMRKGIGAVGARLLYPDGTLQHAGVFTGIGGGAGHAHRFQRADDPGYFERARLPQRVSAVTGACLVVAHEKFCEVGGFDEVDFPVAFNDVDLCLKLNARGWQSFYEPRATLIHHESKSRGSDRAKANRERFAGELAALKRKWHTDQGCDPYHHPHLSPFCEQFLIAV